MKKVMLFINSNATATVCMSVEHPKDSILDVTSMLQKSLRTWMKTGLYNNGLKTG